MSQLIWNAAKRAGGTFEFARLGLKAAHKPIGTFEHLKARDKALAQMTALEAGSDALDRMGIDSTAVTQGLGREGMLSYLYDCELWIACVEQVAVAQGEGTLAPDQVYLMLAGDAGLALAWHGYAHQQLVSASEGNGFTLSPSISTTGAETTAGDAGAVH